MKFFYLTNERLFILDMNECSFNAKIVNCDDDMGAGRMAIAISAQANSFETTYTAALTRNAGKLWDPRAHVGIVATKSRDVFFVDELNECSFIYFTGSLRLCSMPFAPAATTGCSAEGVHEGVIYTLGQQPIKRHRRPPLPSCSNPPARQAGLSSHSVRPAGRCRGHRHVFINRGFRAAIKPKPWRRKS